MALRALRRNKLRTALTMLGIIIGVAAVIAMVGIGNGATSQVENQIAAWGRTWSSSFPAASPPAACAPAGATPGR
jgi:putative ABC transport system permease protein